VGTLGALLFAAACTLILDNSVSDTEREERLDAYLTWNSTPIAECVDQTDRALQMIEYVDMFDTNADFSNERDALQEMVEQLDARRSPQPKPLFQSTGDMTEMCGFDGNIFVVMEMPVDRVIDVFPQAFQAASSCTGSVLSMTDWLSRTRHQ